MFPRHTEAVNPRSADPEHLQLLQCYSKTVQELALAAREFILIEAPEANEFVYEVYTVADHFSFTNRPSDAFVFITTHANWVNVGFNFGSLLPDPNRLLRGEGKWIRHIRITEAVDLKKVGIRQLLRAAIAEAEQPQDKAAERRTVVRRAQSARKRPAKRERVKS